MNTTETNIQLRRLYEEYFPYLIKYAKAFPLCNDEYSAPDNIRLLFANKIENNYLEDELPYPRVDDIVSIQTERRDYFRYSRDYFEQEGIKLNENDEYYSSGKKINKHHINYFINKGKALNFCEIISNPFYHKTDEMDEENFRNKERTFLFQQINILQPDALVLDYAYQSAQTYWDSSMVLDLKRIFGDNITFFPMPFQPSFIRKYKIETDDEHKNNFFSVEGVNEIHTKIYVFTWEEYEFDSNYKVDFLKSIAETIKKQRRNGETE